MTPIRHTVRVHIAFDVDITRLTKKDAIEDAINIVVANKKVRRDQVLSAQCRSHALSVQEGGTNG